MNPRHAQPQMPRRPPQAGVAMLLVMVVMSALLLGSSMGAWMRVLHLRTGGQALATLRAQTCAEAGLRAGREVLYSPANITRWNLLLQAGQAPTFAPLLVGRVQMADPTDASVTWSGPAYTVWIMNNPVEFQGGVRVNPSTPQQDHDGVVLLQATCTDPDLQQPVTLSRLIRHPQSKANGGTPAP